MKYAIGEIILVVIGILIAVQINNGYQNIKQKRTEIEILKGIKADILVDKIDINTNIIGHNRTKEFSVFIKAYTM
ncbi:DUF6090 family protein [Winogradskyella haliclonae]|uniref:DUF6090 family protein n=1 Tax=Winogradskyella haliclonae TaxID=2048558 RepID=UPI00166437ED|nr:DUF6090 family protein [Winogradskyella haliclonae]